MQITQFLNVTQSQLAPKLQWLHHWAWPQRLWRCIVLSYWSRRIFNEALFGMYVKQCIIL